MKQTISLIIILNFILSSCGVTEKSVIGSYRSEQSEKTTLILNPDKSFDFIRSSPDQNLPIVTLSNEFFFRTKGSWQLDSNCHIILTSTNDSIPTETFKIKTKIPTKKSTSSFTFLDSDGDTILISYVQFPDSSILSTFSKEKITHFENLDNRDTIEFHFLGFRPWVFRKENLVNYDFEIILMPEFRPRFFNNYTFTARKNKLIDRKHKDKYIRQKNGM